MKLEDVIKVLDAKVLTTSPVDGKEAKGCYVCDLLSLAMSKVEEGDVWITVQTNVNIAAVAHLTEAACVVVAEGMSIEDAVIQKANSEGIIIARTEKSAFEASVEIGKIL